MILLEVTRKLRRVMTRSSRASDRLDLPARLERSRQNRDRSGVKGAVFRAGESRTPCLRLSISWTINKSKNASAGFTFGPPQNVSIAYQARESSDNPILNAFCRVAPSVRFNVRAVFIHAEPKTYMGVRNAEMQRESRSLRD